MFKFIATTFPTGNVVFWLSCIANTLFIQYSIMSQQRQNNVMERRAIPDLLDKKYYIPEYQRGYRWEKKQVEDLLNDLYTFFSGGTKGQFYCLQPIVIKERTIDGEFWLEVIDGQQRLTTLLIVMRVFDQLNAPRFGTPTWHGYTIRYATRPTMQGIFDTISLTVDKENKVVIDDAKNRWGNLIDSHYIYNAAKYVLSWFLENDARKNCFAQYFYNSIDDTSSQKSVQVVWYETFEDKDPHDIFNRMNSLKVGLSCSELIRSIFLSSCTQFDLGKMDDLSFSVREEVSNERRQHKQSSINEKWDEIEQQMRDKHFQSFLTSRAISSRNAIELLFDLVSGKHTSNRVRCKYGQLNKEDEMYTYLYFKEMVDEDKDAWTTWQKILNAYEKLIFWYHDRELYHRIGFLNAVAEDGQKDDVVCTLLMQKEGKSALRKKVVSMIRGAMTLPMNKEQKSPVENLYQLSYDNEVHKKYIKQLLLLYNVETCRLQTNGESFSFERYTYIDESHKKKQWTLEHIHAQNSDCLPENKSEAWYEWIVCNLDSLKKLSLGSPELTKKKESLIEDLGKSARPDKNGEPYCKTKAYTFENIKELFESVAEFYTELDEQSDKAKPMHQLSNLTLLDFGQNSMVNNSPFEVKRQKICKQISENVYYPICTKKVFLKLYDHDTTQIHSWSQHDRQLYLDDIKTKLCDYLPETAFNEQL